MIASGKPYTLRMNVYDLMSDNPSISCLIKWNLSENDHLYNKIYYL